jgi:hypothetical protein
MTTAADEMRMRVMALGLKSLATLFAEEFLSVTFTCRYGISAMLH